MAGKSEGQMKLERALALAKQHRLEEYAGRAFLQLVYAPLRRRQLGLAGRYIDAGLEYCSDCGLDTWWLYLLASRARVELARGCWYEAGNSVSLVLRDPRSAPVARGWALTVLGLLRARRGDPEAFAPLDEEHALSQPTEELMRIGPVTAARAEAAWLIGDDAAVAQLTDAAVSLARQRCAPWVIGELAYWRWQAGLRDELSGDPVAEPYRLSITGEWRYAEERWKEIGCPYEAALALAESDDHAVVRQSIGELQRLGARPAAAIIARRFRERGGRGVPRGPRLRTRQNPAGLTAREFEVLGLIVEGLRNAQIAERLIVSEKTVDHHVSAVLRKLDVRTRGEAGIRAAQLGLTHTEAPAPVDRNA